MKSNIQPGSKMDKLVKLFVAMRAIIDLTPAGGLSTADPFLLHTHEELESRWSFQAALCDMSEQQARVLCSNIIDGE